MILFLQASRVQKADLAQTSPQRVAAAALVVAAAGEMSMPEVRVTRHRWSPRKVQTAVTVGERVDLTRVLGEVVVEQVLLAQMPLRHWEQLVERVAMAPRPASAVLR